MREFDECMSLLKNENVELHKRIDQLEALVNKNNSSCVLYHYTLLLFSSSMYQLTIV
jgi:hypothetical protein